METNKKSGMDLPDELKGRRNYWQIRKDDEGKGKGEEDSFRERNKPTNNMQKIKLKK